MEGETGRSGSVHEATLARWTLGDDSGLFHWIADMIAASRDRIEDVIGRGNLKWLLITLLVLLALWYARRRR